MNRLLSRRVLVAVALAAAWTSARAQSGGTPSDSVPDPIRTMVARLDLERYKATIKGLTMFGDRRQGTDRNRMAVAWIEAQLKSYGCTNTERFQYEYWGRQLRNDSTNRVDSIRNAANAQPARSNTPQRRRPAVPVKGHRGPTGVNTNPELQKDTALRRINAQWDTPGPREQVYCTKIGSTKPNEMYIIGAHMDGHGSGAAANDDGSGTALVMELARVFHAPDVKTERSIRFILFNNEETGGGASAHVRQRAPMQGIENPRGRASTPSPNGLG